MGALSCYASRIIRLLKRIPPCVFGRLGFAWEPDHVLIRAAGPIIVISADTRQLWRVGPALRRLRQVPPSASVAVTGTGVLCDDGLGLARGSLRTGPVLL